MSGLKSIPAAVALLALALPVSPATARIVPPENSAASQYTETYPAAGGGTIPTDRTFAGDGIQGPPTKALGEENLRELESLGPEGRAAAELAAGTAPPAGAAEEGGTPPGADGNGARQPGRLASHASDGSSGLAEVLGRAVGSSGGSGGSPLVPLAIVGALIGSLTYLLRRRGNLAGHR